MSEIQYLDELEHEFRNLLGYISSVKDRYQKLYENSPDLLRTVNIKGIILNCNESYANKLGYSKQELIGKSIFGHVSEKDLPAMRESLTTWKKEGMVYNKEIWLRRKDGAIFPVLLSATNLFDEKGKLIGSNTVMRDVSEFYKDLKNKDALIKKQLRELGELNSAQNEFMSKSMQKLKTPLTPIKAYIDILLSGQLGLLNEEQQKRIEMIKTNTDLLVGLVSDLSDIQKIEFGELKLNKKVQDLTEIIRDVVTKMTSAAEVLNISITTKLQEKVLCLCDDARIKQVLTNLITNAIDYSKKEKGKIHITLFSDKKSSAKIIVKDNGIGISSSHFEKIFQKFYQIDAPPVREHNGIGLGLTVCKCIIESHGGKIWAESNGKDKGCEFHVLLPLEKKLC